MYPNCNRPKFADQICNVSPMRSIGWIHAGYILNLPHFSNVIALCPKWGRSIKLGTLRSHDWVHSKSNQHFPQEQIKTTFMGTFSINPTFAHWPHWSHLLSVLPMYPACAWWVFWSLSPVSSPHLMASSSSMHVSHQRAIGAFDFNLKRHQFAQGSHSSPYPQARDVYV